MVAPAQRENETESIVPFDWRGHAPKTITKATWIAFSAALAATMMDLLDATIAGVAGPVMQADLGGSYADLQWITAAYTLAMAVGLLTGGRLGDLLAASGCCWSGSAGSWSRRCSARSRRAPSC